MIVTIRVLLVRGTAAVKCVARGYLPSGQELITGPVVEGADRTARNLTVQPIVAWIIKHRPGWSFEIDDQRFAQIEAVS